MSVERRAGLRDGRMPPRPCRWHAGRAIACAVSIAVLTGAAGCASPARRPPGSDAEALLAWAVERWQATPAMEIDDAYKWLFQATQGGEHAVSDAAAVQRYLEVEWASLGPAAADEPMLEPLRPDGGLVRLNLRPYRAGGGSREELLTAFVASARRFRPAPGELDAVWDLLGERLQRQPLGGLGRAAWEHLDGELRSAGFPAVHHSEAYRRAYRPAYRVLRQDDVEPLLALLNPALTTPVPRSDHR